MSQHTNEMSQQEKMVRGTAWSAFGNFASRLLGVIYVIPWFMWMGEHANEANALFNMGYNIYSLFLLISSTGLNVAVAKQIAKYNAMDKGKESIILTQQFLKLMLVIGLISSATMFLLAGPIAILSGGDERLVPVIQSLSVSVLVFPMMSVIRGIFQGYNNLGPFALSQIAEQIVRVIWMLLTAYMIMQIGSGDYISAVTQSTFAAFIGMIASCLVLLFYLAKEGLLKPLLTRHNSSSLIDVKGLVFETLKEAIPFILTGSALQIFSLLDQVTFSNVMLFITDYSKDELLTQFSYFSSNPNKIVMLLISIATSIGGVGITLITENYVNRELESAGDLISNNIQMLYLILMPATMGVIVLAKPLYTVFYGVPSLGALALFMLATVLVLVMALYSIFSPMLQALFENRKAIRYFIYGLVVKVVTQVPFIVFFHSFGPLLSTLISLMLPCYLMYSEIQRITNFNEKWLSQQLKLVVLMTVLMTISMTVVIFILGFMLPVESRLNSIIYLVLGGGVGILVYSYLALKTRTIDHLIGRKAVDLRQKLHIK